MNDLGGVLVWHREMRSSHKTLVCETEGKRKLRARTYLKDKECAGVE